MTIEEWRQLKDVSQRQVVNWIKKGWLPGVTKDEKGQYNIPYHARVPYTARRAKKDESILVSICKACNSYHGVCCQLYGIKAEHEFDELIKQLIKNNLIEPVSIEGITYYNPTINTIDYILKYDKSANKDTLEKIRLASEAVAPVFKATAEGVATAYFKSHQVINGGQI